MLGESVRCTDMTVGEAFRLPIIQQNRDRNPIPYEGDELHTIQPSAQFRYVAGG